MIAFSVLPPDTEREFGETALLHAAELFHHLA
jgi:hypothetical protein